MERAVSRKPQQQFDARREGWLAGEVGTERAEGVGIYFVYSMTRLAMRTTTGANRTKEKAE
jgi:hypothetical protein